MSAALAPPVALDTVLTKFSEVLNPRHFNTKDSVKGVLRYLTVPSQIGNIRQRAKAKNKVRGIEAIFRHADQLKYLLTLELVDTKEQHGSVRIGKKVKDEYLTKPIARGGYGVIYFNRAKDKVIKEIKFESRDSVLANRIIDLENSTREFFLEAFIQTVLANDLNFGSEIARIDKVYYGNKSSSLSRTSGANIADPGVGMPRYLYITMEVIPFSFTSLCAKISEENSNRELEVTDIAPLFIQLGYLLDYLYNTYVFRHGDLHCGNIMADASRDLKLIDFGMSCIKYEGEYYKVVRDDEVEFDNRNASYPTTTAPRVGCDSFDLLILLTSFLQFYTEDLTDDGTEYKYKFSDKAVKFIKSLLNFTIGTKTYNIYDELATKVGGGSVFHQTYPWKLDSVKIRGVSLRDCAAVTLIADPLQFANAFETYVPPASGAAGAAAAAAPRSAGVGMGIAPAGAAATSGSAGVGNGNAWFKSVVEGDSCKDGGPCSIMGGRRHKKSRRSKKHGRQTRRRRSIKSRR
jgi:hypothetical protein